MRSNSDLQTSPNPNWGCIKVKVTDSLTLMIGIDMLEGMIRIRGGDGRGRFIKTAEGYLVPCSGDIEASTLEIFEDY